MAAAYFRRLFTSAWKKHACGSGVFGAFWLTPRARAFESEPYYYISLIIIIIIIVIVIVIVIVMITIIQLMIIIITIMLRYESER